MTLQLLFWQEGRLGHQFAGERHANRLRRTYYCRPLILSSEASLKRACRRGRLEAIGCHGRTVVMERHGAKLDGNSTECLMASAIWNREDPRLDTVYMVSPSFYIYNSVVCRFQNGCSSPNIRFRKFEPFNLRSELAFALGVVLLGEFPRTRAAGDSRQMFDQG